MGSWMVLTQEKLMRFAAERRTQHPRGQDPGPCLPGRRGWPTSLSAVRSCEMAVDSRASVGHSVRPAGRLRLGPQVAEATRACLGRKGNES